MVKEQTWNQCGRKKSYYTHQQATYDLHRIEDNKGMHVYECKVCFCYHAGHKPGEKMFKKIAKDIKPLKNRGKYV